MLTLAHRAMLGAASRPKPAAQIIGLAGAGTSYEASRAVAVDASGNRYVVCSGGSPQAGFLAKFDKDGALLWQRKLSLGVNMAINSCAVNLAGDVFICGPGTPSGSISSGYIAKFNASGALQWQRKLTTTSSTTPSAIAIDASGDVYMHGLVATTKASTLIVKYSSGGILQWQRLLSHASNSLRNSFGLAFDASGNLRIGCQRQVSGVSDSWAVLFKLDNTGGIVSHNTLRISSNNNYANDVVLDGSGNAYICGMSGTSPIIAKFNAAGALQWLRYMSGDAGFTLFSSIAVSNDDAYVYATGGKYVCRFLTADGALDWQRSLAGPGAVTSGWRMTLDATHLYTSSAIASMPSTGTDALTTKLPIDGSGLGTYGGVIVYSESALTSVAGSPTTDTPTFTSTTATHTEAAGDMTDAAGTLTVTPYLP